MTRRSQLVSFAAVITLLGCIGPTRFGLLPPMTGPQNRRDADPTAPLVSSPAVRDAADVAPVMRTPAAESASVSLAALLLWFGTGTVPLIGVFGSFDENQLVEDDPGGCLADCDAPADDRAPRARPRDRREPRH